MPNKLFRADLELNKYWWHRLFKILFVVLLVYFCYTNYSKFLTDSQNHYGRVADLQDRLTDSISKVEDLLEAGERFSDTGWQTEKDFWREGIYCSKNLSDINNIDYIINDTGIDNFNRLRKNKNSIDIESFSMLLRSTNVKCITTDNAEIDFLNPMRHFDDFGFYKPSRIAYLKDSIFLGSFIINLCLLLIGIYLFYYQFLLYIIFGKYGTKSK